MYRYLDAVVVRAAAWPAAGGQAWPDLTGTPASLAGWSSWLQSALQLPGFAQALEQASPALTSRVRAIVADRPASEAEQRRAVLAVLRYLLRATGRATPFGLFAGIAAAQIGDTAKVRIGTEHQAVTVVDAGWLEPVIHAAEADPKLRPQLRVRVNNLVFERDGLLVLEHRPGVAATSAPITARLRATPPLRTALDLARHPVRLADLADLLTAAFPGVPGRRVDDLLTHLVDHRFLLTSLRPTTTHTDPLGHLTAELHALAAEPGTGMTPSAASAPMLVSNLVLDWNLVLPHTVAEEAAKAAGVLVRLARRPHLNSAWTAWHSRFLERYGMRTLVPLAEVVDPGTGIGYPAGYLGSTSASPVTGLSERDKTLLALAQRAALSRTREVVLDEATITALTPEATPVQPTTELTVHLHASDEQALHRGDFTLSIQSASRAAGTTVGRFLHLLGPGDRNRMSEVYRNLPTVCRDALPVQLSALPLHPGTQNITRAPQVTAHRLPLGEFHDDDGVIALHDLAVTTDTRHLFLVSLSRRQVLAPILLTAVDLTHHTHPLLRFLFEVSTALTTPCTVFDWGAATSLPFLPALRYGRTILSPARWRLEASALPGPGSDWRAWDTALSRWRYETGVPTRIGLGDGDQVLRLDLAETAHRALLRAQLERTPTVNLRGIPSPDADGWAGGHAHELVIPLAATTESLEQPLWLRAAEPVARDHGHLPGCDDRFSLKLYTHPDLQTAILTRHLPTFLDDLAHLTGDEGAARWWFLRYHDPDHHLRLRLSAHPSCVADASALLAAWTQRLRQARLIGHVVWDTYFPETVRYGGSAAMQAAEQVFSIDSAATLAQLHTTTSPGGPDVRAITAASMLDLAISWLGTTELAARWLTTHCRPSAEPPARSLYDQAVALANPDDPAALTALAGGERVSACWTTRRANLAAYRNALHDSPESQDDLLADLLHLHHARMSGPDLAHEGLCLHLARAAALSWNTRTRRTG